MRANVIISIGSFNAALAIILSAFAAHGLERYITPDRITTFQTGTDFHLWHSLAIILVGVIAQNRTSTALTSIALLFCLGILLFSGSLYALSITQIKSFAWLTPFGGMSFIISWLWLAIVALKK